MLDFSVVEVVEEDVLSEVDFVNVEVLKVVEKDGNVLSEVGFVEVVVGATEEECLLDNVVDVVNDVAVGDVVLYDTVKAVIGEDVDVVDAVRIWEEG